MRNMDRNQNFKNHLLWNHQDYNILKTIKNLKMTEITWIGTLQNFLTIFFKIIFLRGFI